MRILFVTTLCMVFFSLNINAQSAFHRTYRSGSQSDIISIGSLQMKDGNYVSMDYFLSKKNPSESSDSLIITSYKPKGDINWSRKLILPDTLKGFTFHNGSIVQAENDSLYFSMVTRQAPVRQRLIGAMSRGGALGWMKSVKMAGESPGTQTSHLLAAVKKSIYNAYLPGNTQSRNIYLGRKKHDGSPVFDHVLTRTAAVTPYQFIGLNHFSSEKDSSLLVSGPIELNYGSYFINLDTAGKVLISTSLRSDSATVVIESGVKMPDSSFVFTGGLVRPGSQRGFVARIDKRGKVLWGKAITFASGDTIRMGGLSLDTKNQIIVTGQQNNTHFAVKMSPSGQEVWKKRFPRVKAGGFFPTAPFGAKDGGSVFINTADVDGFLRTSFVKMDVDGKTTCEEEITENILSNQPFVTDSLLWRVRDTASVSENVLVKSTQNAYDVPVVTLEVRPFCPEEPIDWTFRIPPIKGATDYEWSTGDNRGIDTLRVFEEGEYSVTVTINEDVCFMLCDTSKIGRYDKPQAQLALSLGNFCVNNKQTLRLGYVPGHPQLKSINWSTGDTAVASIEIATPGTYKVTIVDMCDETASAEINVGEFPKKITAATIQADVKVDCFGGTATGILTASGNSTQLGLERFLWSTGEKTKSIGINNTTVLNYAVTVLDGCGNSATTSFTIELKGEGIKNVSVIPNSARLCADKVIELNAVTEKVGRYTYKWADGGTTAKIDVKNPGTYTVTVTDICGNTSTKSRDVSKEELVIKPLISDLKLNSYTREDCSGIDVGISFNPDNDFSLLKTYNWSTGASSPGTAFEGKGAYSVTVTDVCDTEYTASAFLDAPDISYAHVFFPDGTGYRFQGGSKQDTLTYGALALNRSFGPINKPEYCLDEIENYEFYIFNRWGQQVFSSNDVSEEWDGELDGKKSQGDTYVWVVKYTIFGFEKKLKGDVTLIRL
ncbi:MAG: gliding motility-associated C-terminal domain-containing protein [Saprospiraceae bacterium]|nr:gliding motility-associated C-terminal domain-containing protein [Saprospiraceae bacterium]